MSAVRDVMETEETVNSLQEKTVNYLASIMSSESITEVQKEKVSGLLHVAADIEHIGDHCKNIVEFAEEKTKNKYDFSDTALAEIYECFDQARRMMNDTMSSLENGDKDMAVSVLQQEKEMNKTEIRLRKKHMQRLYDKTCSPAFTVIYTDVIHNLEKIGDCCNNIAETVLEDVNYRLRSIDEAEKTS